MYIFSFNCTFCAAIKLWLFIHKTNDFAGASHIKPNSDIFIILSFHLFENLGLLNELNHYNKGCKKVVES